MQRLQRNTKDILPARTHHQNRHRGSSPQARGNRTCQRPLGKQHSLLNTGIVSPATLQWKLFGSLLSFAAAFLADLARFTSRAATAFFAKPCAALAIVRPCACVPHFAASTVHFLRLHTECVAALDIYIAEVGKVMPKVEVTHSDIIGVIEQVSLWQRSACRRPRCAIHSIALGQLCCRRP
jgi:hypothetical protein